MGLVQRESLTRLQMSAGVALLVASTELLQWLSNAPWCHQQHVVLRRQHDTQRAGAPKGTGSRI